MAHFTGQVRLRLVGQPFILIDEKLDYFTRVSRVFLFSCMCRNLAKSAEMA